MSLATTTSLPLAEKIDREAKWEPIMQAIFSIKDQGFTVHPVYQPNKDTA